MVETLLKGLKALPDLEGPLQASIWDQGDAVGAWLGKKLVAVVFPTPETLPQVCRQSQLFYAQGLAAVHFVAVSTRAATAQLGNFLPCHC